MGTTTIYTLIATAGIICSIIFAYIGYRRGLKKDNYKEGCDDGTLRADIKYIKSQTDEVLTEQRAINQMLLAHAEKIARIEESAKSAHKRLDEHIVQGRS